MVAPLLVGDRMQGTNMTSKTYDDLLEASLLNFHGDDDDHFRLSALKKKAVLQEKGITDVIFSKSVDRNTSEKTVAVIVSSLGTMPLRTVQNCENAIEPWEKLSSRYASMTMINGSKLVNNLYKMKRDL